MTRLLCRPGTMRSSGRFWPQSKFGINCNMSAPLIYFTSITFSDGTTINLGPSDVVVLVGTNNVGKSVALRELASFVRYQSSRPESIVVLRYELTRPETEQEILELIEPHAYKGEYHLGTSGLSEKYAHINPHASVAGTVKHELHQILCTHTDIKNRITLSAPVHIPPIEAKRFRTTMEALFDNVALERKLSNYFHQAFGKI